MLERRFLDTALLQYNLCGYGNFFNGLECVAIRVSV